MFGLPAFIKSIYLHTPAKMILNTHLNYYRNPPKNFIKGFKKYCIWLVGHIFGLNGQIFEVLMVPKNADPRGLTY